MDTENNDESLVDSFLKSNTLAAHKNISLDSPLKLASRGKRVGAFIVDCCILLAITVSLDIALWATIGTHAAIRSISGASMLPFIMKMSVSFLYAGYFYSSKRATPGKMMFGLEVVQESGEALDFLKAGLRDSLGKYISGIIIGIGYLLALFRSDRCALHDLIFKTKVVEKG